jgi:hypothetical protein
MDDMAAKFTLALYPWVYVAQFNGSDGWSGGFREQEHKTPAEEAAMSEEDRQALLNRRNSDRGVTVGELHHAIRVWLFRGVEGVSSEGWIVEALPSGPKR